MPYIALDDIGDIKGMHEMPGVPPRAVYGATIKEVKRDVPYFTTTVSRIVEAPWLGQPYEGSFMNNIKRLNEPSVKTYRDLEVSSVPSQTHETYMAPENFDPLGRSSNGKLLMLVALAMVLLWVIYGM